VGLVEQDEAVAGHQRGVDRLRPGTRSVAAEQHARTDLIDRAGDDGGLGRIADPAVVADDAATLARNEQRLRAAAEVAQSPGDLGNDAIGGAAQHLGDVSSALVGGVDDDAPIDDEEYPPGQSWFAVWADAGREGKHGHVEAGGLAGGGGQVDALRPATLLQHALDEHLLPGERLVAVNGLEVGREVARRKAHVVSFSRRGRQNP